MNLTFLSFTADINLPSILLPVTAGVIIAACTVLFNKSILGKFVKALLDEKADCSENAKSLKDLGYKKIGFLKFALREGSTLRKVVMTSDGQTDTADEVGNKAESDGSKKEKTEKKEITADTKFYIPQECEYRAEVTYNPDGSSVITILIAIILFIAATIFLLIVVPDLIQMASNAIKKFKSL